VDFAFSEEQELLRDQVRKWLDERCPLEEVRRIADTPEGFSRELWKELGELGFLGLSIAEEHGGAGLGWVDLSLLLEETGRSLFPSPLISTLVAASLIADAGSDAQRSALLPGLADGSRVIVPALSERDESLDPRDIALLATEDGDALRLDGHKHFVADAVQADSFVVGLRRGADDDALALAVVDAGAAGLTVEPYEPLDKTKRSAALRFDGVRVSPADLLSGTTGAEAAIARAIDRGALAVTAEAIGTAEGALYTTVEFAKQRVQFGSPIGRYQGVKHPLAEAYVDIECLKSLCYYAAWAIDATAENVPAAVSEAKALAADALPRIGVTGIQLHGAVGFTLEYDIQLYLKRSKWVRPAYGDEDAHCDRIATLGGY